MGIQNRMTTRSFDAWGSKRVLFLHAGIILVAGWIAFWPALGAGFVYDDSFFIGNNPAIRSFAAVPYYFLDKHTTSETGHGIYRPLRTLSFAVDYALWGLNPKGYHLTSLLFHLGAAVILYLLLARMTADDRVAFFSALLFALHPVQVEAVTYVSSRGDVMDGFFLLAAFFFWIAWCEAEQAGKRSGRPYVGALVFYALAQFSKENATVFVALLVLHDLLFRKGRLSDLAWFAQADVRKLRSWRGRAFLPFAGVAVLYVALRTVVLGQVGQSAYIGGGFVAAQLTMLWGWINYLRLVLFPMDLHVLYTAPPPIGEMVPNILLSAVLLIGLAAAAWKWVRPYRMPAFFLGWGALLMLPAAHVVPINAFIAERMLYLAMAGFAALAASFAILHGPGRRIAEIALVVICLCFGALTYQRNFVWQNAYNLWSDAVEKDPSYTAFTNLGLAYEELGLTTDALKSYQAAQVMWPEGVEAHTNAGSLYLEHGRSSDARREYEAAARLDPKNSRVWVDLGIARRATGDLSGSVLALRQALSLNPDDPLGLFHLGEALSAQGPSPEAVEVYRRAAAVRPDLAPAFLGLGRACERLGDSICAVQAYTRFLQLRQGSAADRENAERALSRLGAHQ